MLVSEPVEIERLRLENAKLKKIRDALIARVERGMGQPSNAFGLFELAISLDKTVRQRTLELQSALRSVEKANEALKRAKQQADEASAVKSTFLAFVSHDLLQPLNAAKLGLSGLLESEINDGRARLLHQVDLSLTSLEELIRTLLDIAKLDAGVIEPEIASFEIEQILEPLRQEFEPIAIKRRLRLKAPMSRARVRSDPLMLKRVVQNLVGNALRYTRSGGVLIGCRRRGDLLRIEVSDTGPGIPEERRQEIFEEFRRGPTSDSAGFGLGLAIVRRLAQALELEVELNSRVGRGSTFAISTPLDFSPPAAVPVRAPAPLAPTLGFDGAQILLVENDPDVASAMDGLLRRWGCEVALAATERETLAAIEGASRVDLVIADMHLDNGERGVDVLDRARERLAAPAPAIVVTADGSQATAALIAARGYRALRKPVKPAELRSLMAYLLG